ncbi:MAG: metal-dependent transcriptional regulator [Planctomycetota bacterium]
MSEELSHTLEDYLETIFRLENDRGFARVRDIAAGLSVAKSAVTAALQSLSQKELVNYQPYDPVTLTPRGTEIAEEIWLRHHILEDFLEHVLGLDPERAESIACEMEHSIDNEALRRLVCFLGFIRERGTEGVDWLTEFRRFISEDGEAAVCRRCMEKYVEALHAKEEKGG